MDFVERSINTSIERLDLSALSSEYHQHDMLVIPNFLPNTFVREHFVPEVQRCEAYIHRVHVPGFKKSGSVSFDRLRQFAPNISQIYALKGMQTLIEKIVGESLFRCPEWDQHSAAIYYYTELGDRIKVHYDKSFYKGKRFTVLLGMVEESERAHLVCYPGASKKHMRKNPTPVMTKPGTLVLFNGDTLWHEVMPLEAGERRAILTLEYITDPRISWLNKWTTNLKDRLLYFGKTEAVNA